MRVTTGVGIETGPVFSPDGSTIAFTGDYDGNVDVFTVPAEGGIPVRVTYHPAQDAAVGWSADGRQVLFATKKALGRILLRPQEVVKGPPPTEPPAGIARQ